ncbi:hypothetical protein EDD80_102446 [Anseongella ginsenosidimutans]|uniref:Uncharacterized protein n=1 Tax=Anseongella ginsenosidimutans TaxID=496056 RepID=A0A4R3KZ31_9SPHI|nr:hypothetical protein EDD80_102446 [Anseongella ginsenosidimutans]
MQNSYMQKQLLAAVAKSFPFRAAGRRSRHARCIMRPAGQLPCYRSGLGLALAHVVHLPVQQLPRQRSGLGRCRYSRRQFHQSQVAELYFSAFRLEAEIAFLDR